MKHFVVEREIPGIGGMSEEQLRQAADRSNEVVRQLGPGIQWVESFVCNDRLYCIYRAEDESLIRRHSEISGFPANRITEVRVRVRPEGAAQA